MSRLLVLALVVSLGNTSVVFAGETLLTSATRIAREAAQTRPAAKARADALARVEPTALRSYAAAAQAQSGAEPAGMRKRTKIILFVAGAVGFAAAAYAIDHRVQDVTPSSLGTRED